MMNLIAFACFAASTLIAAAPATHALPPVQAQYHYLTDSIGITWFDTDNDRLVRWVKARDMQYRPIGIVPQAISQPMSNPSQSPQRKRRRYGPGPDDWEYDSLP